MLYHYRLQDLQLCILAPTKFQPQWSKCCMEWSSEPHSQFRSWLSFKYPHLWRSTLQGPLPVLSLLRHFHSVHIRSAPAGSSSQGVECMPLMKLVRDLKTLFLNTDEHFLPVVKWSVFFPQSESHVLWSGRWKRFSIVFPEECWINTLQETLCWQY